MQNFEHEKQARRELAKMLRQPALESGLPPTLKATMADVPVRTTLRSLSKQYRLAIDHGKREAIKATMRLMLKHRWLYELPTAQLEELLSQSAGLQKRAPRPAGTGSERNEGQTN